MIEKHYWADSERALWAVGAPSSVLTLAHVSLSVSPFFHRSRCDTALSLFASKWLYVSCYALTACAMWSRGSWLGGSLVPHGALLLRSSWGMALWFCCSSLCFCCHTMLRWYNVITRALISPWTGTCHASVWLFCFGLLCFALVWWVCFWFLVFGLWWFRDGLLDYTQVLYQFTLEAPQLADGHVCVN